MEKSFTFSADSFPLSPDVESFLRTRKAIYMDFGSSAYVKSDSIPSIMSELLLKATVESNQKDTVEFLKKELEKVTQEKTALADKLSLLTSETWSLRNHISGMMEDLEKTRAENLQLSQKITSLSIRIPDANNEGLRQSHEKLQKEFEKLRGQSIEAITSLKVLEEENEELQRELDGLKSQRTILEKRQA